MATGRAVVPVMTLMATDLLLHRIVRDGDKDLCAELALTVANAGNI